MQHEQSIYIKVENVKKAFGSQQVLRGLSFDVKEGELLVLIGGSGAGKSVVLKHLIGLLTPDEGSITVDGLELTEADVHHKHEIRSHMGFMFQQGALFDSLTVEENVAFPLIESGIKDAAQIKARVKEALTALGLAEHSSKMPANLSGGMIKRVAVARAMVMMPRCLLYDEPTAGLDPVVADSVSHMIRKICVEKGITTLVVTHDMPSVIHMADRIIFLHHGKTYWMGTPAELLKNPDPTIQAFWKGESGENWSSLHGGTAPTELQKVLIEESINDCTSN